jgi:hypothetical protein
LYHEELLSNAEMLLPGGHLIISIEVAVPAESDTGSVASTPLQHPTTGPAEDLWDVLLLVFQDGELRCHSFPLAAREDRFFFTFFPPFAKATVSTPIG